MIHTPRPAWLMFVLLLFRETARKKSDERHCDCFSLSAKCQYINSTDLVSALCICSPPASSLEERSVNTVRSEKRPKV